jgi:hypothetical protein
MTKRELTPSLVWAEWQATQSEISARIIRYWSGGLIIAALDPTRRPELWIEVASSSWPQSNSTDYSFTDIRGLKLDIQNVRVDGREFAAIAISVSESDFDDVFRMFADEIVEDLYLEPTLRGTVFEVESKISRWMNFFKRPKQEESREEVLGMVGELLFIRDWLDTVETPFSVWAGPFGASKDFVGENLDVEVKVLGRRTGPRVHSISSLDQMNPSKNRPLILCSVRATLGIGKPERVESLIAEVRGTPMFSRNLECATYFDRALEQHGLLGDIPKELSTFELIDIVFFLVDDRFPKLTPEITANLPQVLDVSYQLDVTSESPYLNFESKSTL